MRILYVYKDYFGRRGLYGSMMKKFGHKVIYFSISKKAPKQLQAKHIKKYKPDLVWLLNGFYVKNNIKTIDYIRSKKIPIAMYSTFNPQEPYTDWLNVWKRIDFLFVHHRGFCDYLKSQGLNAHYMPIGFYPQMYSRETRRNTINVSFCGGVKPYINPKKDKRCVYIQSLKGLGVVAYGHRFRGKLRGIRVKDFSEHEEQKMIYSRTSVNLDLPFCSGCHPFYKDEAPHLKNRFFEIPATGNFLLALRHPETLGMFDESMIGYYDDNVESLREETVKYLADKKLRSKMSERAYQHVYGHHTFTNRFNKMFKILKSSL